MSIGKNSLFIFTSRIVSLVVGMLISIIISRVLGPEQRGVYILIITLNALIITIGDFGVILTNTYMIGKNMRTFNEIHANSIITSILVGIIVFSIYLGSSNYLHSTVLVNIRPMYAMLAISLVPMNLYSNYWGGIMRGLNKIPLICKVDIFISVQGSIFTLLMLVIFKLKIEGLLGLFVFNALFVSGLKYYLANRIERLRLFFDKKLFWEVLTFGFKGHLGNIAYYIYNRFDIFIVNFFTGASGVGQYSLSASLAEKTWFLPSPISSAAIPSICESKRVESIKVTLKVARHTVLLSCLVAVILFILAPYLVPLFYGDEYAPAVLPLLILLPGTIFVITEGLISAFFTYQLGKPYIPSICACLSLILYIPISIIVISKMGIIGAAMTSTGIYILIFAAMFCLFKRETGISLKDFFIPRPSDIKDYLVMGLEFKDKVVRMIKLMPSERYCLVVIRKLINQQIGRDIK